MSEVSVIAKPTQVSVTHSGGRVVLTIVPKQNSIKVIPAGSSSETVEFDLDLVQLYSIYKA